MKARPASSRRSGKRLHPVPLVLGAYGLCLGYGLLLAGLAAMPAAIGVARLAGGLALVGLGLYGLWDGVRDLLRPRPKAPDAPALQFILEDTAGQRTSQVTPALLRAQLDTLAQQGTGAFQLTRLPPLPLPELGELTRLSCLYGEQPWLIAFLTGPDGQPAARQKTASPAEAAALLEQFLAGSLDVTSWEVLALTPRPQAGRTPPRQRLVLEAESWTNRLPYFSLHDVELAVDGLADGSYRRVTLELDGVAFCVFPLPQEGKPVFALLLLAQQRVFEKVGTATQVKYWLVQLLNEGLAAGLQGWREVTKEYEARKQKK